MCRVCVRRRGTCVPCPSHNHPGCCVFYAPTDSLVPDLILAPPARPWRHGVRASLSAPRRPCPCYRNTDPARRASCEVEHWRLSQYPSIFSTFSGILVAGGPEGDWIIKTVPVGAVSYCDGARVATMLLSLRSDYSYVAGRLESQSVNGTQLQSWI